MNNRTAMQFVSTAGGNRATGLLKTHKIDAGDLLATLETAVLEVAPHLLHGALYSTESLCGPELWDRLHYDGARRAAGMCLAYLVDCYAVPLMLHKTVSGKGPKRYKLSPAWKQGTEVTH